MPSNKPSLREHLTFAKATDQSYPSSILTSNLSFSYLIDNVYIQLENSKLKIQKMPHVL